jgi:hypothetical protein
MPAVTCCNPIPSPIIKMTLLGRLSILRREEEEVLSCPRAQGEKYKIILKTKKYLPKI